MKQRQILSLLLLLIISFVMTGCINMPMFPVYKDLHEIEVEPAEGFFTSNKILLLDFSGVITDTADGGIFSKPNLLVQITDALEKAEEDPLIKGVILRINSPGGGVTASDLIFRELKQFKKERAEDKKPVIVNAAMMDLAASGGYYVAMAADNVYALPTTVTGSIGVIAMFPNVEGLSNKIGIGMNVFKSGSMKDSGSMFRSMKAEEREVFQKLIDNMYDRFVEVVASNRTSLNDEQIRKLADGRIYTADQAKNAQLIDDVLYLDEVIEITKKQAKISDARIVTYQYTAYGDANIYATAPIMKPEVNKEQDINLLKIDANQLLGPKWFQMQYLYVP